MIMLRGNVETQRVSIGRTGDANHFTFYDLMGVLLLIRCDELWLGWRLTPSQSSCP